MGTLNRADLGLGPSSQAPSYDITGISGSEPGAVAPITGRPGVAGSGPAFSWVGMIVLLILLRVLYEFGRR